MTQTHHRASSHHRPHPHHVAPPHQPRHRHHRLYWPFMALIVGLLVLAFFLFEKSLVVISRLPAIEMSIGPSPVPSPTPFTHYDVPQIPRKEFYTIFFVGDSMTDALGPHPSKFSELINAAYDQSFIIDNYSQGSANITMLPELLNKAKDVDGLHMEPPFQRDYDILVIESFGHNPLSDLTREEGFKTQEAVLDEMMLALSKTNPDAVIIFLATIPPDPQTYGKSALKLPPELSASYAQERRDYLENFIAYANEHAIPLVDVYHQAHNADGSVKRELISHDTIHPSQVGIEFIQQKIVEFILEKQYLPK